MLASRRTTWKDFLSFESSNVGTLSSLSNIDYLTLMLFSFSNRRRIANSAGLTFGLTFLKAGDLGNLVNDADLTLIKSFSVSFKLRYFCFQSAVCKHVTDYRVINYIFEPLTYYSPPSTSYPWPYLPTLTKLLYCCFWESHHSKKIKIKIKTV